MTRNIPKFSFPLLVSAGTLFAVACSSPKAKPAEAVSPKDSVSAKRQTFPAAKQKLTADLQVPGELIAYQQVDLYAKVNSFVRKLNVDVGSEVKQGQLLATLEAPELNSQLAGARSRIQAMEAAFLASKANYDRLYQTSLTPGTVSGNDIDQAMARKNADSAQLNSSRSAYREITDTRNYLEIRAPFNGVISVRNVNPGAYVGPSGKGSDFPLFTLQEQKHLRLVISVPELYVSYFNNKVPVHFTVKAYPDKKFTGTVKRLAGALDSRLRSERVEMDVTNNDKKLLPGMVTEVIIPLPSSDSTFVVPKTALVNSTERMFVIKVDSGKAVWVDVKNGRSQGDKVEVYGALREGDQLVTKASEEIRNGEPVE